MRPAVFSTDLDLANLAVKAEIIPKANSERPSHQRACFLSSQPAWNLLAHTHVENCFVTNSKFFSGFKACKDACHIQNGARQNSPPADI